MKCSTTNISKTKKRPSKTSDNTDAFTPSERITVLWIKRWIMIALLVLGAGLSAGGYTDRLIDGCGIKHLSQANHRYLDEAFDKSLTGFLLLSSIKSGLAVVEGSEVGVGFNLELGDIVQPVYDYVDIAWKAALAGGSILLGMQMALTGLTLIDHWALAGLLLLLGAGHFFRWLRPQWTGLQSGLHAATRFATTLSLTFYLLLPLSVMAVASLSHQVTRPIIENSHQELERIKKEISPQDLDQTSLAEIAAESFSSPSLKQRLTDTGAGIHMLITFLKSETDRIAALTFKLIAAYLFDCILFPLLFGLILITMIKGGVHYFFDLSRLQHR